MKIKRTPTVLVSGVEYRGGYVAINGPQMVEDARVNRGMPTSVWDMDWEAKHGRCVPMCLHADSEGNLLHATDWEERLAHSAGRHPKLDPAAILTIRREYWSGETTQAVLSSHFKVDRTTIWRIIHGVTAWYY
jgi:hypothetical protein